MSFFTFSIDQVVFDPPISAPKTTTAGREIGTGGTVCKEWLNKNCPRAKKEWEVLLILYFDSLNRLALRVSELDI